MLPKPVCSSSEDVHLHAHGAGANVDDVDAEILRQAGAPARGLHKAFGDLRVVAVLKTLTHPILLARWGASNVHDTTTESAR